MSFFHWLILGFLAYASGFSIRQFQYKNQTPPKNKVLLFTQICFALALLTFALVNLFVLKKAWDFFFIGISSLLATGIFYYGLTTDNKNNMDIPD